MSDINSDEILKTLILKESLEDINLFLAEIESTVSQLSNDLDDESYFMLQYKLLILEIKMSEINSLITKTIGIDDKNKNTIV